MQDEDKVKKRVKSKKRNAEKRKEKSRDAARTRRSKEADVFSELSGLIPFPTATVAALDKTSMMRLCISYLKLRKLGQGIKENLDTVLDEKIQEEYLSSINGFLVIMDRNGDMVYISENIMKHLGLSQIDLVGQNVYEYSHPCDHDEIREVLDEKHNNDSRHAKKETTFFARLKCTLTSKGRNVNLKSATFKVIRFRGHHLADSNMECWVLIGESIPHPTHMDVPLDSFSFLSRHSMDMKFSYCDSRVEDLLAYDPEDLMVKPLYEFHHALDGEYMDKMYKTLFSKGQVWTDSYRFLASGGGYAWVETQATVVYNNKTDKPQYVICIHYMISGIEEPDTIMSGVQMSLNIPSTTGVCKRIVVPTSAVQQQSSAAIQQKCESPILSMKMMESIFVPKTKEMDSGICAPKRKLKEEADLEMGLIAPTAGEVISLSLDAADSDMAALLQDMLTGADIDMDLLDSKKLERPMPVNLDGLYGITANKKIDIPTTNLMKDEESKTMYPRKIFVRLETLPSGKKQLKPIHSLPLGTIPPDMLSRVLPSSSFYSSSASSAASSSSMLSPSKSLLLKNKVISDSRNNTGSTSKKICKPRGSVSSASFSSSSLTDSGSVNNASSIEEVLCDKFQQEERVHNWLEGINVCTKMTKSTNKGVDNSCNNGYVISNGRKLGGAGLDKVDKILKNDSDVQAKKAEVLEKMNSTEGTYFHYQSRDSEKKRNISYRNKYKIDKPRPKKRGKYKTKNKINLDMDIDSVTTESGNDLCKVLNKLLVGKVEDDVSNKVIEKEKSLTGAKTRKRRKLNKSGDFISNTIDQAKEEKPKVKRKKPSKPKIQNSKKSVTPNKSMKSNDNKIIMDLLLNEGQNVKRDAKTPDLLSDENIKIADGKQTSDKRLISLLSNDGAVDGSVSRNISIEELKLLDKCEKEVFCSDNAESEDLIINFNEKQLSEMIDENFLLSLETCSSPIDPPLNDNSMAFNIGIDVPTTCSNDTAIPDKCMSKGNSKKLEPVPFVSENVDESKPVTKEAFLNTEQESLQVIKDEKVVRNDAKVCTEFDLLDGDENKMLNEDTIDSIFHDLPFSFKELMSEEKMANAVKTNTSSTTLNTSCNKDASSWDTLKMVLVNDDNDKDTGQSTTKKKKVDSTSQNSNNNNNNIAQASKDITKVPVVIRKPVKARVRKKKKKPLSIYSSLVHQRKYETKKTSSLVISIGYLNSKVKKEIKIPTVATKEKVSSHPKLVSKLGDKNNFFGSTKHDTNSVLYQLLTGT